MRKITEMTDEELALKYVDGDNQAFDELLARNQQKLFDYIMFMVHDQEQANDIFQDTFVKIIQTVKSKSYKDDGRFLQFAMRIAHNLVIDYFRKESRIPTVESSSEDYNYIDNVPITDHSVEQGMIVDQV